MLPINPLNTTGRGLMGKWKLKREWAKENFLTVPQLAKRVIVKRRAIALLKPPHTSDTFSRQSQGA
jgi:hypothetical protein